MKARIPEILLILSLFLPFKSNLPIQVLLCQIQAIRLTRRIEKQLAVDLEEDTDPDLQDLLIALWRDPENDSARAYLGLLAPHLGLVSQPILEIRRQIARNHFEYAKQAVDLLIKNQISLQEIKAAIFNGTTIDVEFPDKNETIYLIAGSTESGRTLHIKCCDRKQDLLQIIVAYDPEPEQWEENFSIRRNEHNGEW